MSSGNTTNPSYPPEDKSQYHAAREGDHKGVFKCLDSQNLRLNSDDDLQRAKEIFSRFNEYGRAHTDNHTQEYIAGLDSNPGSDSDLDGASGVRPVYNIAADSDDDDDDDDSDEEGPVDRAYSHFEWGVDEPEFEGYPEYSDDEAGYDSDYDDPVYDDDDDGDDRYNNDDEEEWYNHCMRD
ncbi:hypothetical protein BJX63DRAFT_431801 [Aspergillus granulosus]|uniref:Transcription factor Iwr1 domain-containing protein n=1 Tax=Aspergillus granulosus TaxID=176169 RepID=A0ABR4HDX9_9EURO